MTEPKLNVFQLVSDNQQNVHSNKFYIASLISLRKEKKPRELQSSYQFYQPQYEQQGEGYAPMRTERGLVPG